MTTKFHDPIPAGSLVSRASVNMPLGQLDEALGNIKATADTSGNLILEGTWDGAHLIINDGHFWVHDGHYWFLHGRFPDSGTDGTNLSER